MFPKFGPKFGPFQSRGLWVTMLGVPVAMAYNYFFWRPDTSLPTDKDALVNVMWNSTIIFCFLAAGIAITVWKHKGQDIKNFLAENFPRSAWWGYGLMLMSIPGLFLIPAKTGTDGEATALSTLMAAGIIIGFILAGLMVNAIQYPAEFKEWLYGLFKE